MNDFEQLASAWARAWESDDSDAFVRLFAEDAVYRDDQAGRLSRGHAELHAFHAHFAAALSGFRLEITNAFRSGTSGCLEWMSSGVQSGTYHGSPPTNKSFRVPGATVLEMTPDHKVLRCVDYYDGRTLARQLGEG